MNNYKIILLVVWLLLPSTLLPSSTIIQKAMAENATMTNTTIATNTNITLGNPIYTELVKPTSRQADPPQPPHPPPAAPAAAAPAAGPFTGSGMIKGINFTDAGIGSAVLRPDGYSDLHGKGVITTIDGREKASYTYMAIGHADANGIFRDNGALFFHTNSTGKLASINGLVVIYSSHRDKAQRNFMNVGWEWSR
ncbi:MAG TPA: hypothetical protein VEH06_13670 [Candidatus Bathyarchaeia archaeon]|nr:hypothetical protein [Candidatus Bathyarchaeia archaeon]